MMENTSPGTIDPAQAALAQTIYEGLRDEIAGGKLRPGQSLSRRGIAKRFGTSPIPVIEALARLENTGLVEAEARQAARVRTISLETIQDNSALREALETQAIRRACETATPEEIERLHRLAEAIDGTEADPQGPEQDRDVLHWQFHREIARISGCRALVRELERVELLRRLQANWYSPLGLPDPPRGHSLLVDAIQGRDPIQADASMRAHIRKDLERELLAYRMKMEL